LGDLRRNRGRHRVGGAGRAGSVAAARDEGVGLLTGDAQRGAKPGSRSAGGGGEGAGSGPIACVVCGRRARVVVADYGCRTFAPQSQKNPPCLPRWSQPKRGPESF
jgi:hypothetical protein